MFAVKSPSTGTKLELLAELVEQARALLTGERDRIANAANIAALIYHTLPDLNWAGFYFMQGGELVLGPFQGKPACVRIALGRGVCGTAARDRETIVVPDVEAFPGHIACDSASRSELVVPIVRHSREGGNPSLGPRLRGDDDFVGVLDLDSPSLSRFDAEDAAAMEKLVAVFVESTDL